MNSSQLRSELRSENSDQTAQAKVITLAYNGDERRAKDVLRCELEINPNLNILELTDSRGYTLLHVSALNSLNELALLLFSIIKEKVADEAIIKGYINTQTDEGFTALHFSAFRGNIVTFSNSKELGADLKIPNFQGLNALHIASQGDQPVSIAYFLKKGLDVGARDLKGSTALHWAAFLGCENSTNFLTVWNADPNLPDKEGGLTPLHLAVISGNTRVVRRLLIRGADRNLRTRDGKQAMDLAKDSDFDNIVILLRGSNFFIECCNIRPGLGNKRSKSSLILFFILYVIPHIIDAFFIFPYTPEFWEIIVFVALFILSNISFLFAWLVDPGYLPQNKKEAILELLEQHDCFNICPECAIVKPPRSRHCEICKRCVQVFDHHCPWIDNCVGAWNHGFFYLFILTLQLNIIFLILFSIFNSWNEHPDFGLIPRLFDNEELYFLIKEGCCIVTGGLSVLFFFPMCVLVFVQSKNLLMDKTTNERFGHQHKKEADTTSISQSIDKKIHVQDGETYSALIENPAQASCGTYTTHCLNMCYRNARNRDFQISKKSLKPQ